MVNEKPYEVLLVGDNAWAYLVACELDRENYSVEPIIATELPPGARPSPCAIVRRVISGDEPAREAVLGVRRTWPGVPCLVVGDSSLPEDYIDAYGSGAYVYIENHAYNVFVINNIVNHIGRYRCPVMFTPYLAKALLDEHLARQQWKERSSPGADYILGRLDDEEVAFLESLLKGRDPSYLYYMSDLRQGADGNNPGQALIDGLLAKTAAWSRQRAPTPRRVEVVRMLAAGLTPQQIGSRLGITANHVYLHARKWRDQWRLSTTSELVACAQERGYLRIPEGEEMKEGSAIAEP